MESKPVEFFICFHWISLYLPSTYSAGNIQRCSSEINDTWYCNGTALPPERSWRTTARWTASAIRSRKLSINVATIKAWARPTLEILPKSQNHTNKYLAKCVTSYFLVWLVVTRLVVIRYSKHSPGLRLSFVSLR